MFKTYPLTHSHTNLLVIGSILCFEKKHPDRGFDATEWSKFQIDSLLLRAHTCVRVRCVRERLGAAENRTHSQQVTAYANHVSSFNELPTKQHNLIRYLFV